MIRGKKAYIVRPVCDFYLKVKTSRIREWFNWLLGEKNQLVNLHSVEVEGTEPYHYGDFESCVDEAGWKSEYFETTYRIEDKKVWKA